MHLKERWKIHNDAIDETAQEFVWQTEKYKEATK